jgi:two-component system chemotaxis sensor kinase CheA
MAQDPYKYFRLEARDLLDQFAAGALDLEKGGGGPALIQRLLRLAHTLKGAARVVKQPEIAERAHLIEDALSPYRDAADKVPDEQIGVVRRSLDDIGTQLAALTLPEKQELHVQGGPGDDSAAQDRGVAEDALRTVRADIAEIDTLLDGVSETHALLNGLRNAAQTIEQAQHLNDLLVAQLRPRGGSEIGQQPLVNPLKALSMAQELRRHFGGLERDLGSSMDQMDRELRQLRDSAEQLRLVSAGTLFTSLERTALDTARALSKTVTFEGHGNDIRLDAHVLGVIQGGLVQLVRNSVAHGIERDAERRAAGKPAAGRVTVDVSRQGRRIVFECRDDGRGLDLEAVRRVAALRGVSDTNTRRASAEDLIRLLLRGGISTSDAVTEISGRGIGLDVVREAVERLGGEVNVHTEAGKGTTFRLVVPPSLASMEALIVEASEMVVSIPLDAVQSSVRLAADEISQTVSGASIVFDGRAIPFIPLALALDGTRASARRGWTVIVVAGAGGIIAAGVDRLLGTGRIVIHPLPQFTPGAMIVAGVSLDAEGNPQLVLDPDGLVARAQLGDTTEFELTAPGFPVLIIDDSLTTRMLEQSILESAGYEVDVAICAEDALEYARRKRYSLFLVDVEMPGMDGFTFVERIRADPALSGIPAILVTSLAAPEDRQRGFDVGAQGYVIKSEFDQAELLTLIKPLVS